MTSSGESGGLFSGVLLLNEDEVRRLLPMDQAIEAVETGLRQFALDEAQNVPRARAQTDQAMLHVLSASAKAFPTPAGTGPFLAAKFYTTSRNGPARFLVPLFDGTTGQLLALIQADHLGQMRTGAASGVATKYMAREDATDVGLFGSGKQARTQVLAVCRVRKVRRVSVFSRSEDNRRRFAEAMSRECGTEVVPVSRPQQAAEGKDIIITATTSREPVLHGSWVAAGTHINAIGSNFLGKAELDVECLRRCADVVVDSKAQARLEAGDLHETLEEGSLAWSDVRELGQVVVGRYAVRERVEDVTLFKSLGVGIEDLAVAAHVHARARAEGVGRVINW
jgi:alanine dehydrogenase